MNQFEKSYKGLKRKGKKASLSVAIREEIGVRKKNNWNSRMKGEKKERKTSRDEDDDHAFFHSFKKKFHKKE